MHCCQVESLDHTTELIELYRAVICKCEREIASISRKTTLSSKRILMNKLFISRILITRLYLILKWSKEANDARSFSHMQSQYEENLDLTLREIKKFSKSTLFSCNNCLPLTDVHKQIVPEAAFKINHYTAFVCLLQTKIPPEITKIVLNRNVVTILYKSLYKYSIKISSSGKFYLKAFDLNFPAYNISTKIITTLLVEIFSKSEDVIYDAHQLLISLYYTGQFITLINKIKSFEDYFGFQTEKTDEGVKLTFYGKSDPRFSFIIKPENNGIHIFSSVTHEIGEQNIFYGKFLKSADIEVAEILSEMSILVIKYQLHLFSNKLTHAFIAAGIREFKCTMEHLTLEVSIYGEIFCDIFLDRWSGKPIAKIYRNLGISPSQLIHALHCAECERITISNNIYNAAESHNFLCAHSLHNKTLERVYSSRLSQTRIIQYSYAPDFYISFSDLRGRPHLEIVDSLGHAMNTQQMMFLNDHVLMKNCHGTIGCRLMRAFTSAKVALLLLQLRKDLNNQGRFMARLENNTIHFNVEPFECVEFRATAHQSWSLFFMKPAPAHDSESLLIFGQGFTADFSRQIIEITASVSLIYSFLSTLQIVQRVSSVFTELRVRHRLSFDAVTADQSICAELTGIVPEGRMHGVTVFRKTGIVKPHVRCSRHSVLTIFANLVFRQSPSESRAINQFIELWPFVAAINQAFCAEDTYGRWRVAYMKSLSSVSLVYRGRFSLEIEHRTSKMDIVDIIERPPSSLLVIPLKQFVRMPQLRVHQVIRNVVSCPTYAKLKEAIESFCEDFICVQQFKVPPEDINAEPLVYHVTVPKGSFVITLGTHGLGLDVDGKDVWGAAQVLDIVREYPSLRRYAVSLIVRAVAISKKFAVTLFDGLQHIASCGIDIERTMRTIFVRQDKCARLCVFFMARCVEVAVMPNESQILIVARENGTILQNVHSFEDVGRMITEEVYKSQLSVY